MRSLLKVLSVVALLPILPTTNSISETEKCQVMPDELIHLVGTKEYVEVDDFYSILIGVTDAPFVYGYKKDKPRQCSVAFWCKDSNKDEAGFTPFILIFAERDDIWDSFKIVDVVQLSTIGGLSLRIDTTTFLSEFWQVNTGDSAPESFNFQDYVIESYYDGNTVYFFRYQKQTFMYYELD